MPHPVRGEVPGEEGLLRDQPFGCHGVRGEDVDGGRMGMDVF